jgi:hypothetical protein
VQARRIVVAQLAHVASAQAPGLAGHNGGGYLAAGLHGSVAVLDFGTRLREFFERDEGVRGVEADADKINEISKINWGQLSHTNIVMGRRKKPGALRT